MASRYISSHIAKLQAPAEQYATVASGARRVGCSARFAPPGNELDRSSCYIEARFALTAAIQSDALHLELQRPAVRDSGPLLPGQLEVEDHAIRRFWPFKGVWRMRLPVVAKIALSTAGAAMKHGVSQGCIYGFAI